MFVASVKPLPQKSSTWISSLNVGESAILLQYDFLLKEERSRGFPYCKDRSMPSNFMYLADAILHIQELFPSWLMMVCRDLNATQEEWNVRRFEDVEETYLPPEVCSCLSLNRHRKTQGGVVVTGWMGFYVFFNRADHIRTCLLWQLKCCYAETGFADKGSFPSCHSILTRGQPVLALFLNARGLGRKAARLPVLKS